MKKNRYLWLIATIIAFAVAWMVPQPERTVHAAEQTYTFGTDTTFSPFAFTNKQNKSVGIDIDLLDAIAKKEGFKIQWKQLGFDGAVQALQAKQIDAVAAGMSITPERQKTFLFSHPYYKSGTYMAVKDDSIKGLKNLRGKKVAVKTGTTAADYANSVKKKYGFKVTTFDSDDNMYQDVLTGNTVACFEDKPVMQYAISNGIKLHLAPDFKEPDAGTYGFAFQKSEGALAKKVNHGLKTLKANGQYAKIVAKYVGNGSQKSQAKQTAKQTETNRSFFGLLKANAGVLASGLGETLELTVVGIVCATIVGILMGLLGVLPNKGAQGLANLFIYVFRGLPLMVLALFIYTGVPTLIGTKVPAFIAGIVTLTLNEGAYTAAFVKGGIKAVDIGQTEAARSLGLPWGKTMRRVVLPQGIRIMIPSFINQFIITLKDTSILSVIGLLELTQTGKIIVARNMEGFKIWSMVALIYVIIITLLTWLSNWVQKRVHA